jgi:magnesium-transporting ATPase (P-type)
MNDMNMDAPKRPTLLTVLCVLSFIWSGILIIGGIFGYFAMKMFASGKLQEMLEQTGDPSAVGQLEEMQAKIDAAGLTADQMASQMIYLVILTVIWLIGVIMMWKLRRTGFWIFAPAVVISILLPMLLGGNFDVSAGGLVSAALPLIFVALYGTQLKAMR